MSVGLRHARDEHVADTFLAALADSFTPPGRTETQVPAGTLTSDDESMLRELERSDGSFIESLVDEVWGNADRLDGLCLSDEPAPDEDRARAEAVPPPDDPAERLAQAIVNDWAWAVIDSSREAPAHRWACCKHFAALCHPSPDHDLLVKVLDLDAAWADILCWSTISDCHPTCLNVVCCLSLTEAPGRISPLLRDKSAYCDTWDRFLVTSLASGRGSEPSRLWSMVNDVARTFCVQTYDRVNVLRLLLGGFGKRVLFAGLGEHLFPDDWYDADRREPEALMDIGASFIDYFRECSRVFAASTRGYPSEGLGNFRLTAGRLGHSHRAVAPATTSPLFRGLCESVRPAPPSRSGKE